MKLSGARETCVTFESGTTTVGASALFGIYGCSNSLLLIGPFTSAADYCGFFVLCSVVPNFRSAATSLVRTRGMTRHSSTTPFQVAPRWSNSATPEVSEYSPRWLADIGLSYTRQKCTCISAAQESVTGMVGARLHFKATHCAGRTRHRPNTIQS